MKKTLTRLALLAMALIPNISSAELSPEEGTFTLAGRFGIAPTTFGEDARFTSTTHLFGATPVASATDVSTATLTRQSRKAAFSKLYNMPFFMGFDIGYFTIDCFEIFVNFDYMHACSDSFTIAANVGTVAANTVWKVRDLHQYGFYLGGRYYFSPYCAILPFIGGKIGINGHSNCGGGEGIDLRDTGLSFTRLRNNSCAALSGGLQAGFDWCVSENYFFTFMTEMIGTAASFYNPHFQIHKAATAAVTPQTTNLGLASQVTNNPRGSVSFPITFGLRIRL